MPSHDDSTEVIALWLGQPPRHFPLSANRVDKILRWISVWSSDPFSTIFFFSHCSSFVDLLHLSCFSFPSSVELSERFHSFFILVFLFSSLFVTSDLLVTLFFLLYQLSRSLAKVAEHINDCLCCACGPDVHNEWKLVCCYADKRMKSQHTLAEEKKGHLTKGEGGDINKE